MEKTTVYIKRPISELPKDEGEYNVLDGDYGDGTRRFTGIKWVWLLEKHTHWLEPVEGYFMTEDELKEFEKKTYDEGFNDGID